MSFMRGCLSLPTLERLIVRYELVCNDVESPYISCLRSVHLYSTHVVLARRHKMQLSPDVA